MTRHAGVFVTGTDTGVGKTVVSAALLLAARSRGGTRYWKPIQTGIESDDDTAYVTALTGAPTGEVLDVGIRLARPVSPHLAARWSGTTIVLDDLVRVWRDQPPATWVVEGAGGVLVPVSETATMADLMTALGLPVVVVARTTLGTINHTLLTLEVLRGRAIVPAGVVMVGAPDADNREAIERYGAVPVLASVPRLQAVSRHALEAWLAEDTRAAHALAEVMA